MADRKLLNIVVDSHINKFKQKVDQMKNDLVNMFLSNDHTSALEKENDMLKERNCHLTNLADKASTDYGTVSEKNTQLMKRVQELEKTLEELFKSQATLNNKIKELENLKDVQAEVIRSEREEIKKLKSQLENKEIEVPTVKYPIPVKNFIGTWYSYSDSTGNISIQLAPCTKNRLIINYNTETDLENSIIDNETIIVFFPLGNKEKIKTTLKLEKRGGVKVLVNQLNSYVYRRF